MENTKVGYKIAEKLQLSASRDAVEIISVMHRHCVTYRNIQERWCNGYPTWVKLPSGKYTLTHELSEKQSDNLEKQEMRLEFRIRVLVSLLSETTNSDYRVEFQGDPRGNTVKLFENENFVIGF